MYRFVLLALLGFVVAASAQSLLEPDTTFFGIPGLDSISGDWFLQMTDTTDLGFADPRDVEVVRFSPSDYRLVMLDAYRESFVTFPVHQQQALATGDLVRSGEAPDTTCKEALAMCLVQHGLYFNSDHDQVAVAFATGAQIGIYRFDRWTSRFTLLRSFSNAAIKRPVGLFWAFNNFFIVDDSAQAIFRTDSLGTIISRYGPTGLEAGYHWASDISGYVDGSNVAHLYVGDGAFERVDHLTATASNPTLQLHSQAVAQSRDTLGLNTHETAYLPGAGVLGLNRFLQQLHLWSGTDDLAEATRSDFQWAVTVRPMIHIRAACGRLVLATLGSGGWSLRTYRVNGAVADDPEPYPSSHWTADMSPIHLTTTYHVEDRDTLVIEEGVHVLFDSSAALVVDAGAVLQVNGTAQNRVVFDAVTNGQTWRGLRLDSDSPANHLTYATVSNAVNGVEVWNGRLDLRHASISNCRDYGVVYANSTGYWNWSGFGSCGRQGAFLISSHVSIDSCDFKANTRAGLRCVGGDYDLQHSRVVLNQAGADTLLYPGTGVELLGAHLSATCDTIDQNDGPALLLFAGSYARLVHGWNRILDNQQAYVPPRLDLGQICVCGGLLHLNDGFNTIAGPACAELPCQNRIRNLLIDTLSTDLSNNYWGSLDPEILPYLLPVDARLKPSLEEELACGVVIQDTSAQPLDEALFNQAYEQERQGLFTAAAQSYHLVWKDYPESNLAQAAMDREYFSLSAAGWAWKDLKSYFNELALSDSLSDGLRNQCLTTVAWCYVGEGEFNDAEARLDALIDQSTGEEELISLQLHLFMCQLLENRNDSLLVALSASHPGQAPATITARRDAALTTFATQLDSLLAARLNGHGGKGAPAPAAVIPTRYALYQNYPNPFNPVTEIRFDLPEAVNVELKIYNLLGQEVVTLLDAKKPAGAYTVAWDSKSAGGLPVSSGTYIYRLKAGTFVDAKKMTLLK
jgi:hypothetical protein